MYFSSVITVLTICSNRCNSCCSVSTSVVKPLNSFLYSIAYIFLSCMYMRCNFLERIHDFQSKSGGFVLIFFVVASLSTFSNSHILVVPSVHCASTDRLDYLLQ